MASGPGATARTAWAAIALLDRLATGPSQNGDAHVGYFQVRRNGIPIDVLGICFQVGHDPESHGRRAHAQKFTPPNYVFCRHYLSFSPPRVNRVLQPFIVSRLVLRSLIFEAGAGAPEVHCGRRAVSAS